MEKISRREFVKIGGTAVGMAALGGTSLLAACGSEKKYPTVPMTDEKLVLDLDKFPLLAQQGQGMLFQVPNNTENIVVIHLEGGFVATGAQCPHKGCSVRWQPDQKLLVCPCHKSSYTAEGACVRGPGWGKPMSCEKFGKSLTRYNAVLEGNTVIVTALEG